MYELKAFAHIGALVDNNRGVVAPIGELSPIAMTYSREKEYYNTASVPGQVLVVFSSKRDGKVETTNGVLATALLGVSKWIYDQAQAGSFTGNAESFRTKFIVQYGTTYSLNGVGTMIKAGNNVNVPGYIEIRDVKDETLRYRLWFASEIFEQQYDEYEIKVVPPVDDLEVFFQGSTTVKEALADRTPDISMERLESAKGGYPETKLRSELFQWWDPNKLTNRIDTYWTVLIQGVAGNNIDAIKEAIKNYILANSKRTKEEWAKIFPEIFTATEFIIVPMWGFYSVTNRVLEKGLYSSITKFTEGLKNLKRLVRGEGYTEEWIEAHAEMFNTTHMGLNCTVIGGPKNRDNIFELYQRYPDYFSVRSTEDDFMRMAPETRRFVLNLEQMLLVAENMTPDSSIPVAYSRMTREDVLYLVATVDKFQFLIASKFSYEDSGVGQASNAGEPVQPT